MALNASTKDNFPDVERYFDSYLPQDKKPILAGGTVTVTTPVSGEEKEGRLETKAL